MVDENQNAGDKSPTPEEREAQRGASVGRLKDSYLQSLALPVLGGKTAYGSLFMDDLGRVLETAPDQENYAELYKPLIESDVGVRSETLVKKAARIYSEHLSNVKVEDLLGLGNSERKISDEYEGVYVSDLNDEVAKKVIGAYQAHVVEKRASKIASERSKLAVKSLEELVCDSLEGSE
tara:strand:+ start:1595 stop:2131 length:537 start_codon:yes stop_codon:yes gene_type:complete